MSQDLKITGDFYAKNLISGKECASYWLKMPDEIYPDLYFIRGKNYEPTTSNSPIAFILKANSTDKFHKEKFVYSIDVLTSLDR